MSSQEYDVVIKSYNEAYRNSWEQTRFIAYVIAASFSEKIKKLQDVLKFTWDIDIEFEQQDKLEAEKEMLEWLNKL